MLLRIKLLVTNKEYSKRRIGVHPYIKESPNITKEIVFWLHKTINLVHLEGAEPIGQCGMTLA